MDPNLHTMQRTSAAALDAAALAAAFSTVYADYLLPVHMNAAQIERHVADNSILLERSPLWLDAQGGVVGLALLGVRGQRGWVGGFGIALAYRGRGLSHALMAATLEAATQQGLRQVQLEVLSNNAAAMRTYERAGFVRQRDLRIFSRDVGDAVHRREAEAQSFDVSVEEVVQHSTELHAAAPAWQREPESVRGLNGLRGIALGDPKAPIAYALYEAGESHARLVDLAVRDEPAAHALLQALEQQLPGRRFSLVNEPAESPACAALEARGWRETLRQHEMIKNI